MVSSTPQPHFTPGKDLVSILQEAGRAPGPVWTGGKSRPHRDSIPDRPALSQSLYRLSYPAHNTNTNTNTNTNNTYSLGNLPAELLKNAPQKLYKMIAQPFTICINEHIIPKEWKIAHIIPIFKHCDNYRAISVTNTFSSRLFGRIVRDLIETEYSDKEAEEQVGFRAVRS